MNPADWRTYLVTQASLSGGRSTEEVVRATIDGGVDVVQLREKDTSARERYELGCGLRGLTERAGVDLIVNDRIDIAEAVGAEGVHLGQSDLPVSVARDLLGSEATIGCSTSTVAEAERAEAEGADYLGVGAVYVTESKAVPEENSGIGPERVREIAEVVSIPIVGIGGITAENAPEVVEAGASSVAVISEIAAAEDPAGATEALSEAVRDGESRA